MEIFAFDINISVKESVSVKEFKQKLIHGPKIRCSCVACRYFKIFVYYVSISFLSWFLLVL